MKTAAERIPKATLAAYAIPNLPHSLAFLPVITFVPAFYATDLAMPFAIVGLMLFLTRLTDIVTDPIVGAWSDRTRTPWGRRKPFIVAGLPILVAATWYVFVPGESRTPAELFAGLFFMYLGFTLVDLPYNAWGAELSKDYDERTRVAGWRSGMGAIGTMAALSVPAILALFGYNDTRTFLFALAIAFAVVQPLAFGFALWRVREPPPETLPTDVRLGSVWSRMRPVIGNRPFRRLLLAAVLAVTGLAIGATLNLIFCTHVIGAPKAFPYIIFAENVASFLGLPLFLWISKRFGKHRAFAIAAAWYSLSFAICLLMGPGDLWAFAIVRTLAGGALLGLTVLTAALTADVVDRDLLETGEARTGLFFACLGMATKLAVAIGVLLGATVPSLAGFQPSDAAHTADGLWGLKLTYGLIAPLVMIPGIFLMWGHPLTREVQQALRQQVAERRAAEAR
jgi:Na+/melibiose symporter-like transporter